MSKILSIGTAVPAHKHEQNSILQFMQHVYALNEVEKRKIRFLYHQSGIAHRYSVISDYSRNIHEWKFYPQTENLEPFPSLEHRMNFFNRYAASLSVEAIRKCLGHVPHKEVTHLITVSCTGMSAPGLDLQVMELLELPHNIYRTSVNFMGCYAAIHALKMADMICKTDKHAKVLIVCTELCTLHFQKEPTMDNIASSLLFGDGSAAVLVVPAEADGPGITIKGFYAEVAPKGKKDMSWELSSSGFLMTLSGYVPDLIEEDFDPMIGRALQQQGLQKQDIQHWCIHPGGKRILESIEKSLGLERSAFRNSYDVLNDYGNMSSPTVLFVLERFLHKHGNRKSGPLMAAAFGPGLTMETFTAIA